MRELNACGFSIETIAALAEWPDSERTFPPAGHYFHAAFRAEDEQRALDYAAARTKEA